MAQRYERRWTATVSVSAGQTSAPILVPEQYEDLTVGAVPGGGGTVLVEFALAAPDTIDTAPGSVTWYSWDEGAVAVAVARVLTGSVTAIRATAVNQPGKVELVARFDR